VHSPGRRHAHARGLDPARSLPGAGIASTHPPPSRVARIESWHRRTYGSAEQRFEDRRYSQGASAAPTGFSQSCLEQVSPGVRRGPKARSRSTASSRAAERRWREGLCAGSGGRCRGWPTGLQACQGKQGAFRAPCLNGSCGRLPLKGRPVRPGSTDLLRSVRGRRSPQARSAPRRR
jgi:hypothetical protein